MWHRLTLAIADVPAAMRVFDLLRRLDVAIHGFCAGRAGEGFTLHLTCDVRAFAAPEDLTARLAGLVGVHKAAIAPDEGAGLLGDLSGDLPGDPGSGTPFRLAGDGTPAH